jgi:hypothetical protein
METIKTLTPIAGKACSLEEMEPMSIGEFFYTLCKCAELPGAEKQKLFENVLGDLIENELLDSCEFHEGMSDSSELSPDPRIEGYPVIEAYG